MGDCVSSSFAITKEKEAPAAYQAKLLSTDHLLHDIGRRAVSGGFVTVGAQVAKFVINLVGAAILARLLSPKEFGLVGMVLAVTGLVALFRELGLSTATVQRQTITQQQVSNLFWVNVSISGILTVLGLGLAPFIGTFYRDPRVAGIMMALSLTFLLTGSTVQHQALLARQLRFRALARIDVTSMLIGFVTACCLAKLGFSYWALVVQQLVNSATFLLLIWYTSEWRPSMPKRGSGVRPMLRFGAHLAIADFVTLSLTNSDSILVGRVFGAEPLGLYTRASVLLVRPLQQISSPINAVLIPVLSRLQSDSERYRRTFMRAYDALALIFFSFAAVCLALARPLVLVVLGPKWSGAIPLFSAFALMAVSFPLSDMAVWNFQSQGRGRDQLQNHTVAGAVALGSYLVGLHWGPLGIILSLAITSLMIRLPITYYFAGRSGPVTTSDLWASFLSHLPCWGTVYLTTTVAYLAMKHAAPVIQLLMCGPIGIAAGAALFLLFRRPRQSAFCAWNTVKNSLARQWSGATS
jgi:O-antigen/teichoic acid export membrane protein